MAHRFFLRRRPRPRVFKNRLRLDEIPDWDLKDYRLSRERITSIVELIEEEEDEELGVPRAHKIPADTQVFFIYL